METGIANSTQKQQQNSDLNSLTMPSSPDITRGLARHITNFLAPLAAGVGMLAALASPEKAVGADGVTRGVPFTYFDYATPQFIRGGYVTNTALYKASSTDAAGPWAAIANRGRPL